MQKKEETLKHVCEECDEIKYKKNIELVLNENSLRIAFIKNIIWKRRRISNMQNQNQGNRTTCGNVEME